jgi:hypothetical protein
MFATAAVTLAVLYALVGLWDLTGEYIDLPAVNDLHARVYPDRKENDR